MDHLVVAIDDEDDDELSEPALLDDSPESLAELAWSLERRLAGGVV